VTTDIATVSKSAVIYITVLFCGVVGLQTVMPVAFAERPAFYREQQSEMYSVAIYAIVTTLVEIPYLILSCLCFTLPFFYIVGFQVSSHYFICILSYHCMNNNDDYLVYWSRSVKVWLLLVLSNTLLYSSYISWTFLRRRVIAFKTSMRWYGSHHVLCFISDSPLPFLITMHECSGCGVVLNNAFFVLRIPN
jgi:hypothetical protein